jgi:hypothetical protein
VLLEVCGESEWKGVEAEGNFEKTGDVGMWRRIGIWGKEWRFGSTGAVERNELEGTVKYRDVVRSLETADRVDGDWIKERLKDIRCGRRVSSR